MASSEDVDSFERRIFVRNGVPEVLKAYHKFNTLISPFGLGRLALGQVDKLNERISTARIKAQEVAVNELVFHSADEFRLTLNEDEVHKAMKRHLKKLFAEGTTYVVSEDKSEARFLLPDRVVFLKILNERLDSNMLERYMQVAIERNPSETWLITFGSPDQNLEVDLNPVFGSENSFLCGKFKIIDFESILQSLGGWKEVTYVPSAKGREFLITSGA